jgi:hypothetical protein
MSGVSAAAVMLKSGVAGNPALDGVQHVHYPDEFVLVEVAEIVKENAG